MVGLPRSVIGDLSGLRILHCPQCDNGHDLRAGRGVTIFGIGEQGRGPDGRAGRYGGLGGKSGLHGQGAG